MDEVNKLCFKRKREEVEIAKMEEETKGMMLARIFAASMELERISNFSKTNMDEGMRMMYRDILKDSILDANFTTNPFSRAKTARNTNLDDALAIYNVADKLGYDLSLHDFRCISEDLKGRSVKLYHDPPPENVTARGERRPFQDDYVYKERDRPLMTEAVYAYFKPCDAK